MIEPLIHLRYYLFQYEDIARNSWEDLLNIKAININFLQHAICSIINSNQLQWNSVAVHAVSSAIIVNSHLVNNFYFAFFLAPTSLTCHSILYFSIPKRLLAVIAHFTYNCKCVCVCVYIDCNDFLLTFFISLLIRTCDIIDFRANWFDFAAVLKRIDRHQPPVTSRQLTVALRHGLQLKSLTNFRRYVFFAHVSHDAPVSLSPILV